MAKDEGANVRRYETIIATLVGVSALFVSGYTAYVQRQQVRAAVWPILESSSSNEPDIRFVIANKGVGPAIVGHVAVTVDGQAVRTWHDALVKILGPGRYSYTQSTIRGHVLAAGEVLNPFVWKESQATGTAEQTKELRTKLDEARQRVEMEICYCSTLGECWTLRTGPGGKSITETRTCPPSSDKTFQE
jgi:hypothetical protein